MDKVNEFSKLYGKKAKTRASLVHARDLPSRAPQFKEIRPGIVHEQIPRFLTRNHVKLYTHQADALDSILGEGKNVVISTPTASGKSMCYLIPIIDALIKSGCSSTSLLVFPLKALAQDQYAKIKVLLRALDLQETLVGVYDADATADQKRKIRASCKIIITNPYGLHQYLQNLRLWSEFFKNIQYIVFDEVHVYNGVFGSNIAFVMRRLERAANAFGKNPQWILCSATIGNPKALATKLVGLEFHLVDNDGSARS
nr:DEAD/DEAH box helicase [Candidatus Sigynarchaeota archaeon]